ncbi:MAG: peptide-methionine (R)-S-oxide reductase MsrB [Hyphomonadaceae bacterium]|nr:peptide-methionine (R)-S-oxide reductase MsrB [Hyphomonadaceae bacterium]
MTISRRALFLTAALLPLAGCSARGQERAVIDTAANHERFADSPWRRLSEAEWRARLDPLAFRVLRQEATERAGTSALNAERGRGTYVCAGCGLDLFRSEWKFDSGTGWPSFFRVIETNIGAKQDFLLFTPRTEYHCARCLGHQGHVFDDGPRPTGLRYCNNGAALRFVAA